MPKDRGVRKAAVRLAIITTVVPILALVPAKVASAAPVPHLSGSRLVEVVARPNLPTHTIRLGAVRSSMEISGAIGLKSRDQAGLDQFLANVTDRYSPDYQHYLSKGAFASRFGASAAAVAQVSGLLRSDGLDPSVSANKILVSFHGSAATIERAFGTGLSEFRFSNGNSGWGTTSAARLPASIAANVSGVVGLDDLVHESTSLERAPRVKRPTVKHSALPRAAPGAPVACGAAQAQAPFGGVTDEQLAHAYGVDGLYAAGDLGQGQTVDIFELEPFAKSDLLAFDKCYFGSAETNSNNVSVVTVDGGAGVGPGSGEAALDVQDVSALAPHAKIDVYEGPDTNYGSLDTYNTIATADNARVVSTSWGLCEGALQQGAPGTQEVESEIFAETAAQGQSVFAAAGDDGSDDCSESGPNQTPPFLSVDDPESQPYVTSVGGTTFTDITESPGEAVWNDGSVWGGGGGGISDTWAEPSWQAEATVTGIANAAGTGQQPCSNDPSGAATDYNLPNFPTTLPSGTSCRLVPDVTALADEFTGITIFWDGSWSTIGGTSSSTPLWAGMTAEMNASSFCSGTTLGFISPLLYEVASSSAANYAAAFNDITIGNNDDLAVGDGTNWKSTVGYDLASGLGSPKITDPNGHPGLAQQACDMVRGSSNPPTVSSISPDSGPVSSTTAVTITGTNFGTTMGDVFVGTRAAAIVSWSATSIVIDTPLYNAPQGTGAPAASPAPVTVVTKSPERSSSLDPATTVFHYLADPGGTTPVIDFVGPTGGRTAGGYEVDLVGSGLSGATSVTFGGQAATIDGSVNTNNGDNTLTVTVPAETGSTTCVNAVQDAGSICQVQVQVTTPGGTSAAAAILPAYQGPIEFGQSGAIEVPANSGTEVIAGPTEFDYAPTPVVTSVSPKYGAEFGGTLEDITGTGFNLLTYFWTDFGPASQASSQDFNIQAITADGLFIVNSGDPTLSSQTTEPEPQTVTIQTSAGDYVVPGGLFALAGVPNVSSLSTHVGSSQGGQSLTLAGKGFGDVQFVQFSADNTGFGNVETTIFTHQSDTRLTLVTPADLPLATEVIACTATGCSEANGSPEAFVYGYPGAPHISKISPSSGPASGRQGFSDAVSITGTLLDSVVAIRFGTVEATAFESPPGLPGGGAISKVLVLPPPGTAGTTVKVALETAGGVATGHGFSNTLNYTYVKSVASEPRDVTAKSGNGAFGGSWKPPASDGGSPITGYVFELVLNGNLNDVILKASVSMSARSHTFKVAAGGDYAIAVAAKTSRGVGLFGTSVVIRAS